MRSDHNLKSYIERTQAFASNARQKFEKFDNYNPSVSKSQLRGTVKIEVRADTRTSVSFSAVKIEDFSTTQVEEAIIESFNDAMSEVADKKLLKYLEVYQK